MKIKVELGPFSLIPKCKVIEGDISLINLGISEEDRLDIVENVNFIYHMASNNRINGNFKESVFGNVRGTKQMIELAKECKKLEVRRLRVTHN